MSSPPLAPPPRGYNPPLLVTHANPYVGPRAFTAGERLFGRDRELADLVDLVIAERIVLLHAPSGAGKSSLLQAGLTPRLRAEGLVVLPVARVGLPPPIACRDRFTLSVLLGLEEDVPKDRQTPLAALAERSLADYLDHRRGDGDPEVLILDQFEELLTIDPAGRPAKLAFLRELGAALRRSDRFAVLALREDWLAAIQAYRDLLPTRLRAGYRLELLGPAAALAAIQGPAAALGVRFTDAAAGKLVDDLRQIRIAQPDGSVALAPGPSVEPVQLQVACRTLWSRLSPGTATIDVADLAAIGDVDHALSAYIDDELAAVATACKLPERLLRTWLARNLVTDSGLRSQVLRGATDTLGLANPALAALVDAHLVRADERRGMTWIELAHDRLVAPLLASNRRHADAHLGPLERQADLWDRQGRPESLLLADPALLAAADAGAHTPAELAFLAACQQLQRRRARERRSARFIAALAALACLGLVVAVLFAIRASKSAATADKMRDKAERERSDAEAARQLALARQLGAQAQTLPLVDYQLAALLAVEASARAPAREARGPLLGLEARWPRMRGLLDTDQEIASGLVVDPQDGAVHLLFGQGEMGVRKYGPGRAPLWLQRDAVRTLAFAAAGPLYASTSGDSRVQLRDRSDGAVRRDLGQPFPPGELTAAAALSPDAATLVVGSDAGLLVAYDLRDARERWRVPGRPELLALVATDDAVIAASRTGLVRHALADGQQLATVELAISEVGTWPGLARLAVLPAAQDTPFGFLNNPPMLVDMATGTTHAPVERSPGNYFALALHPNGHDLAACSCSGECSTIDLHVWDGLRGELQHHSDLGSNRPLAVGFTPGGADLVLVGAESVRRHDIRPRPTVDPGTAAAAFLPDDRLLTVHARGLSRWTLDPLQLTDTIPLALDPAAFHLARDRRRAVIVGRDAQAVGLDLETRARLFATPAPVRASRLAPGELDDGRLAVAGLDDGSSDLVVWDATSGALLARHPIDDPGGFGLSWPEWSGGRVLTSTCARVTVTCAEWRLWAWDPAHPERPPAQPLPALAGQIDDFDTSPDGQALVASAGGSLVRWRLPGLDQPTVQRSDAAWGGSMAHGQDGRFLAAADQCAYRSDCPGMSLQLIDAVTLQPIGAPQVVSDANLRVLAAGRDHVLTSATPGESEVFDPSSVASLWDLRLVHLQRRACQLAARELTRDEWARHLGDLPYRALCSELASPPSSP